VQLARVAIPGVVSADVLHALATSPREQVFQTKAAKAIVLAAWDKVKVWYYLDLFLEITALASICHLTTLLDHGAGFVMDVDESKPAFGVGPMPISMWVLLPIWVYNLLEELTEFKVFFLDRPEWRDNFFTSGNIVDAVRNVSLGAFFALISQHASAEVLAPVLAFISFNRWWKTLYAFRALDYFGERLLPILGAFREVLPFTLVLVFYAGAFANAFYALSHQGFDRVFVSVYRLGVLGDFTLEGDVFGTSDRQKFDTENDEFRTIPGMRLSWWWMQLALFFGTSFLLTVAMMNIFIQVMGSAFDRQEEVSEARFIRSRASICLYYFLRPWLGARHSDRDVVWMCYQERPTEEMAARSMRLSFTRTCGRIRQQLDQHLDYMDEHLSTLSEFSAQRFVSLEGAIDRLNDQVALLIGAVTGEREPTVATMSLGSNGETSEETIAKDVAAASRSALFER